jgi:carbonic anhydrase
VEKIISGIAKFQKDAFKSHETLFSELATGQSPEALFITCADSRIDPNLVTQSEPGRLFICRNAGNIVPPHTKIAGGVTASIEYAVAVLEVKNIIICGHTDCGAMKGALNLEGLKDLPHVHDWLDNCRAAVDIVKATSPEDELTAVTEHNVLMQLQHLRTHPAVASRLATGKITLHGWVYNIEDGGVTCYDESQKRYVPFQDLYAGMLESTATA